MIPQFFDLNPDGEEPASRAELSAATIYPLLKPRHWEHRDLVAHVTLHDSAPIIAFGFDAGGNYQFVTTDNSDDVDALYPQAFENLSMIDDPWEVGESGGLRFVTTSGHDFSSEQALDPKAMLMCHGLPENHSRQHGAEVWWLLPVAA